MSFSYCFKFIIVGESSVGKTSLLLKFTDNTFSTQHDMTIGVEFGSKLVKVSNHTIKLQIWDTAGSEKFKSITRSYYKGAAATLLIYDVTNIYTFQRVCEWLNEVNNYSNNSEIVIILVGNKIDLEYKREVTTDDGHKLAMKYGIYFMEVSAKSGVGIKDVFNCAAGYVYDKIIMGSIHVNNISGGIKRGFMDVDNMYKKDGCDYLNVENSIANDDDSIKSSLIKIDRKCCIIL